MRESPGFNTSVGSEEKFYLSRVQAVINKANCKEATEKEVFDAVNCGGVVAALDENF